MTVLDQDIYWMHRALELARRGIGVSSPNPAVGCVILDRAGQVIGEGWHEYDLLDHAEVVALREAAGLPIVFLSYERLLAAWEPELRRCAAGLGLEWPERDEPLRQSIESFIDPSLGHYRSPPSRLRELPPPVLELYQALSEACLRVSGGQDGLEQTVERLSKEFHAYASLFQMMAVPPTPGRLTRMWRRWQVSVRKRLPTPARAPVARAR